jgi:hypothetical protein
MMWHVNLTLPYLVPTAPWSISREGDRQASFPPCILNVKQFLMSLDARATSESESYERCGVCFRKQYLHSYWTDIQRIDSPAILWSDNVQS